MKKHKTTLWSSIQIILPWLVLAVLLAYAYAKLYAHPYVGFRWEASGQILIVFVDRPGQESVQVGDRFIQLGSTKLEDFNADYGKTILNGYKPGQVIPLVIERNGQVMTIPWELPGFNQAEFLDQLRSEMWLAFVFWIVGTLAFFNLRPRNQLWALMVAFNYLTALWISFGGSASAYHIWYGTFLLRVAIWFCVPVYLQFHWNFPQSLGGLPRSLVWVGYILAGLLSLGEIFQIFPASLYYLGFLLAIVGSILLIIAHAFFQPASRRVLRLLIVAVFLAFVPSIMVGILGVIGIASGQAAAGIIGLPFVPMAYFYVLYRRQIGEAELRVNRFVSIYLLLLILVSTLLPLIGQADLSPSQQGILAPLRGSANLAIAVLIAVLVTVLGYPYFESFVKRRLLGIAPAPTNLYETYATRIVTSTTVERLSGLLQDHILEAFFVRQFAFLEMDPKEAGKVLLAYGIAQEQIPAPEHMAGLLSTAGKYRPSDMLEPDAELSWIRLVLPLKIEDDLIGIWLLGRRDPDDLYSQEEIDLLRSLANQTAIALSNIQQTERLREIYQENINRYEEERLKLALDLHDSILNQMAVLLMKLNQDGPSPAFDAAYNELTTRLREIVKGLRPPLLTYGLKPVLEDLAESMADRSNGTVRVEANFQDTDARYDAALESHIYRIVQEACENALKHAHPTRININGSLLPDDLDLTVEDDGTGFIWPDETTQHDPARRRHYGLVGMQERASLVGATLEIDSAPGRGTRIRIQWVRPNGNTSKIEQMRHNAAALEA